MAERLDAGECWLGADIGTTVVKAALYRPDGTPVASAERPSAVSRGPGGRSEQDMAAVRDRLFEVLAELAPRAGGIAALGIAAQGDGLWCVDEAHEPVGPAMLWNDTREAAEVERLLASGASGAVGRACHTSLWPGTSGALWRWLEREAPDRAERVAHAGTCADWIGLCLTGRHATDRANASIPFLDLAGGTYSEAALAALGCEGLASRLPAPRGADEVLGGLTAGAAAATGLPEGLPVSVGTLDLAAMMVGLGMEAPGETLMILGTTAVVVMLVEAVEREDMPAGASALHPVGTAIERILAPTTGAAAFDWFAALHPMTLGGATPGEVAERLNAVARDVPPGCNGLTFLPYLSGERAPFVAPSLRGAFLGLSQSTTKAEMGRAVMEGAAFSLRHCFEAEDAMPSGPVRLTGGGARNPLWCRIIADTMGVPVIVSEASDHGLWGAACLGAAAAGRGHAPALAKRDEAETRHEPDPGARAALDRAHRRYLAASRAARAYHQQLAEEML